MRLRWQIGDDMHLAYGRPVFLIPIAHMTRGPAPLENASKAALTHLSIEALASREVIS